jgi:hypothetical protein
MSLEETSVITLINDITNMKEFNGKANRCCFTVAPPPSSKGQRTWYLVAEDENFAQRWYSCLLHPPL